MANKQIIDRKDKKILKVLFEDGRASIADIAKKTKLRRDTIARRIKKMQADKVILGFIPYLNTAPIGLPNFALVLLRTKTNPIENKKKLVNSMIDNKFIIRVSKMISKFDYFCVILYKNTEHLNSIVEDIKSYVPDFIEDLEVYPIAEEFKIEDLSSLL